MKTKKEELLEMLHRHGGMVTARYGSEHRTLTALDLRGQLSLSLPDEVWAAGFDHWRAER